LIGCCRTERHGAASGAVLSRLQRAVRLTAGLAGDNSQLLPLALARGCDVLPLTGVPPSAVI